MTDDARRVLTEEERARIQEARRNGGTCAGCGRVLGPDETAWVVRFDVYGDGRAYWHAPVGEECVAPAVLGVTEGTTPEPCAGCGRGVIYYPSGYRPRSVALCSKRCSSRSHLARRKEAWA